MTLLIRTTVKLPYVGGLDRDVSENVWFAAVDGTDPASEITAWVNALGTFYTQLNTSGHSVSEHIAAYVDRSATEVGILPLDEADGLAPPGTPTVWSPFALSAAFADTALPSEVACCFSFKNDYSDTGIPERRRRGRVYIGPLHTPFPTVDTFDYSRPHPSFREDLKEAGQALLDASNLNTDGWTWVIYSRPVKVATPTVAIRDGLAWPVTSGWIDNEWDTQRRRGMDPTSRVTFTGS